MLLKFHIKSKMAHFGTPFSNHTSKLSHLVPSKSAMKGMVGAAKGISFLECQELNYRFSFHFLDSVNNQLIAKNRMLIEVKNNIRNIIRGSDWESGKLPNTIDFEEHLYNEKGYIEAYWFIEVLDEEEVCDLVESILNPVYPIYLGKTEHLVRILGVEYITDEKKYDCNEFNNFFIGESEDWLFTERMVETMRGYRDPKVFENVYTLKAPIKGISKYGYYKLKDLNVSVW